MVLHLKGSYGGGTINKFIPATNNLIVAKSFDTSGGTNVSASLLQAGNGKLYGITNIGGNLGYGVIFL